MSQRFTVAERLKSKKLITKVFKKGVAIKAYPLLAVYYHNSELELSRPAIGFSVPKRKLKLAVDRNLCKRRIREAYRIHKADQKIDQQSNLAVMFVYLPSAVKDYATIEKGMVKILQKLNQQLETSQG